MGAWIEINALLQASTALAVAPLAGARIEIPPQKAICLFQWSLPSWKRGLKYGIDGIRQPVTQVAPLAGARIEIEKTIVYIMYYVIT